MVDPLVYIVVLNWNGGQRVAECVRSVLDSDYAPFRLVVVDNASSDGSVARLRNEYPEVEFVLNSVNAGFSGGSNLGITHALASGADFVLLLNNDVILDRRAIPELVASASDQDVGLTVPKIYYQGASGRIWSAGAQRRRFPPRITIVGLRKPDGPEYCTEREMDCAVGCVVLVKAGVFRAVGLLDAGYFMYFEDYDFSLRARAAGYRVMYTPKAVAWHAVSASSGDNTSRMWYLWARSMPRFYFRNFGWPAVSLTITATWIAAREVVKGNGRFLGPYVAGLRAGLADIRQGLNQDLQDHTEELE